MHRSSKGGRRVRASLIVAVAALSVMAFGASAAKADPFTTEIDDAALKIPGFPAFDILDPPDQATFTGGDQNTTTGVYDVPAANFVFPEFSTGPPSFPIELSVDLDATDDIDGTITPGTGQLDTVMSTYTATVSLAGGPDCVYTIDLAFSTEPDAAHPIAGNRFVFNAGALAAGPPAVWANGVMSEGWATIPPAPDPVPGGSNECAALNGLVGGPGGLALGNGVDITPPAPPTTTPPPATQPPTKKAKKCKKKKKKKGKSTSAAAKCKKKKKKK